MEPSNALEKEIVILVAQGFKNREIAEKLCLAEQTVRNYVCVIYQKVGVNNRAALVLVALRAGLFGAARQE